MFPLFEGLFRIVLVSETQKRFPVSCNLVCRSLLPNTKVPGLLDTIGIGDGMSLPYQKKDRLGGNVDAS
jgi:hypothetical protein